MPLAVSERTYWLILALVFLAITLFFGLWAIPYKIIEYNLAVNLFTSSIFMVLTVVLLSWLLNVRKKAEWKAVEHRVLRRMSDRLYNLTDAIDFYFLGDNLSPEYQRKMQEVRKIGPDRERMLSENRLIAEFYASHPISFGDLGNYFFEGMNREGILEIKEEFLKEQDRLEHMISEYFTFLQPVLINSIMAIEDEIDRIVFVCGEARTLAGVRKNHPPLEGQVNSAKEHLKVVIQKIAEEVDSLNKKGIGF
jgi:hypothetical protein